MNFSVLLRVCIPAALLLVLGCIPTGQTQADEEKEPHFLAGKSRVNAMDFQGAIDSFENALEANPRSAAAHFELAWLLDTRQGDAAAAIFHYERYLRLRTNAFNADIVRQRIMACKQQLVRDVSLGPVSEKQQRELEKVAEENKKLLEDNRVLNEEVLKWRVYFAARSGSGQPQPLPAGNSQLRPPAGTNLAAAGQSNRTPVVPAADKAQPPQTRKTHMVKAGETPSSIARQYGIKPASLLAANPGLDPKRLRPGKVVNIP